MSVAVTHKQRVLDLLGDGRPHSHHELYALHVIGHSRIADLRRDGHVIEQWRDGDDYLYRLVSEAPSNPGDDSHVVGSDRIRPSVRDGGASQASNSISAPAVLSDLEPAVSGGASGEGNDPGAGAEQLALLAPPLAYDRWAA